MNTKFLWSSLLGLLLSNTLLFAQQQYRIGLLPSINLNLKLPQQWSINFKVESRQRIQEGTFGHSDSPGFRYILTDFSLLGARKLGFNAKLSGGYLIRVRGAELVHRTIQQYVVVQKMAGFRLAHRLAADQTFAPKLLPTFRVRYRLTLELPLDGEKADPKECYVKINHEYLNSLEEGNYDLEIRLVPLLGYSFTDKHKLETGLDYRVNSFITNTPHHSFRWVVNWYYSF